MNNSIAISAAHVSKIFHLGRRRSGSFRETWEERISSILKKKSDDSKDTSEFLALDDVSFEVKSGEVIGIIGKNGAGKSTLLKILSRITPPTKGRVEINGRVSSLLEVGTGFHPELTGRENIFMNGAIMGMKRAEIRNKFDEIVDFSGIAPFIDTPVKRYSSGMYVRLAFAVAAHLEPEILIVDEVLAVGDAEFQQKCLGKMKSVSAQDGRTVLFVSHNMQAITTLTQKTLVLKNGRIIFNGATEDAVQHYFADLWQQESIYEKKANTRQPSITHIEVVTSNANQMQLHGKPMQVRFSIHLPQPLTGLALSFQIINHLNMPVIHTWHFDNERNECTAAGRYEWTCHIPHLRLYQGKYYLKAYLSQTSSRVLFETIDHICPFEVTMFWIAREFQWEDNACVYLEDANWITAPQAAPINSP